MNRILFTAAAGALAMYFLDPQGGRRRRVRTRDRAERMARRARQAYDVTLRDTRHRAMGMKAIGRGLLKRGPVDDETLAGRVRAVLGRYVSHPHAIEVDYYKHGGILPFVLRELISRAGPAKAKAA